MFLWICLHIAFLHCCDSLLFVSSQPNGYHTHSVHLQLRFFVIIVMGYNKLVPFQLLVVELFPFSRGCLLLSKIFKVNKKMPLCPIQCNMRLGEHAMLAARRKRRIFFVFMFWQMQQVRRIMWVHPINEMRMEYRGVVCSLPGLASFSSKVFQYVQDVCT